MLRTSARALRSLASESGPSDTFRQQSLRSLHATRQHRSGSAEEDRNAATPRYAAAPEAAGGQTEHAVSAPTYLAVSSVPRLALHSDVVRSFEVRISPECC